LPYNDLRKEFRAETQIQKIFSRKGAKGAKLFHKFNGYSLAKTPSSLRENSEQEAASSKQQAASSGQQAARNQSPCLAFLKFSFDCCILLTANCLLVSLCSSHLYPIQ
jgi:hypothetical protein